MTATLTPNFQLHRLLSLSFSFTSARNPLRRRALLPFPLRFNLPPSLQSNLICSKWVWEPRGQCYHYWQFYGERERWGYGGKDDGSFRESAPRVEVTSNNWESMVHLQLSWATPCWASFCCPSCILLCERWATPSMVFVLCDYFAMAHC